MYKTASRFLQHRAFFRPIKEGSKGQDNKPIPKIIKKAFRNHEFVRGCIAQEIKGGYAININEFRAFCPYSEMYPIIKTASDIESIQQKIFLFLVLKVDLDRGSVVVSRKKAAQLIAWERAKYSYSRHSTLRGTVKDVKPYGAFIDIGGMDGLLHVSEMSSKEKNQEITLKVGKIIEVYVIGLNKESQRISLSTLSHTQIS